MDDNVVDHEMPLHVRHRKSQRKNIKKSKMKH